MAILRRTLIQDANIGFGRLSDVAPDLRAETADGSEPWALGLVAEGGAEIFVFLLDEAGKAALVKALTGGIIIPNARVPGEVLQ